MDSTSLEKSVQSQVLDQNAIYDFWSKNTVFKNSIEKNSSNPTYTYYDGPPFATGLPHYGHITAGFIKDSVTRFYHGQGYNVPRNAGYDCHGLPIEFEIEKILGIKTRDEIIKYGIGNYNEACRGIVLRCSDAWEEIMGKLGRWIDFKNDYKTMTKEFMNSTWWVFKQLFEKNRIYEGVRIMPYSTTCGTPLSNFETQQNYQEVQDDSLFIKLPLVNKFLGVEDDVHIMVWTTTPWTLPSNYALCVNGEIEYSLVKHKDKYYIVSTKLIDKVFKESVSIISSFKGTTLVGLEYIPPFTYNNQMFGNSYKIVADSYVTETDGTGIVHLAPAYGADDYRVCINNGLITKESKLFQPLDTNGYVTSEIPEFTGMFYKFFNNKDKTLFDLNTKVVIMLKEKGFYYDKRQITHNYPFCWRSDTPLIYRAVSSWFIKVEDMQERMVELNKQINWIPGHVGESRFSNWLANAKDWGISRSRFWGTPIPIWKSDDGDIICVGSSYELEQLAELEEGSVKDLHRHLIDDITIKKNGKEYKRIPDVLDCIAKETRVSLGNGRSISIENMEKYLPNVMSFNDNGTDKNIGKSKATHFMNKGIKKCIEIKLEDGRTLECTPEHKILVFDNNKYKWINANDVKLGETRIVTSVKYPEININVNDVEKSWQLQCDEILLRYDTFEEQIKSMTFSRLLGYILTNGSFENNTMIGEISGTFMVENFIDVEQIVNDIELLCGRKPNINFNESSNVHTIYTPKKLLKAFLSIEGIEVGRKIDKCATLPSFLISKENKCPIDIIREFLSGMFGGNGISPCVVSGLSRSKTTYGFKGIGFVSSKTESHLNSLKEQYKIIVEFFKLFNINNVEIKEPYHTYSSKKNIDSEKKFTLKLVINDEDDIINFYEKIGFAYCSQKQLRLEICSSWKNMCKHVITGYKKMFDRVSKIKNDNLYDIKKSYNIMLSELDETEIIYDKISLRQIQKCISKNKGVENCLPNIPLQDWLKSIGAYSMFFDENIVKGKNNDEFISSYYLNVIGKRDIGKKEVFDISVENTHSFLANGLVVHNCWFESGSMPYSSLNCEGIVELLRKSEKGIEVVDGCPFIQTTDGKRHNILPADFIAEGLDQTRGWFYTLLVLSVSLFDMIPFKNVIVNGLVLAEDGKKMSKRLKNYPDPMEVVKEYGSDCLRLYLLGSSVVRAEPLKFSKSGVHNMMKDIIIPYKNTVVFFKEYLNLYLKQKKSSPLYSLSEDKLTNPINVWIVSQYSMVRKEYYDSMKKYDLKNAVNVLSKLVNILNNGYIKLGRNLLKGKEGDDLWAESLSTMYYIIKYFIFDFKALIPYFCEMQYLDLKELISTPYFTETTYSDLKKVVRQEFISDDFFEPTSIHLNDKLNELSYLTIGEEKARLSTDFDIVYNIIGTIYQLRGMANMSAKKPLRSVSIVLDDTFDAVYSTKYKEYLSFVSDECNILDVRVLDHSVLDVKKTIVPNRGLIFKKYGKTISDTYSILSAMSNEELDTVVTEGKYNEFEMDSSLFNISYKINVKECLDETTDYVFKEINYGKNKITILADKFYDESIDKLYFYRLVATLVQRTRKYAGLHPWDEIKCYYGGELKYSLDNEVAQEVIKSITKYNLIKHSGESFFFQHLFKENNLTIYLEKV
jgi:isoleucyl-tRNA synthetase